jgi:nucleotide-binding universal stress UspA family protein
MTAIRPVVVGIDGTPDNHPAIRWGAEEAHRRGRPLRLVHVYHWPPDYGMSSMYATYPVRDEEQVSRTLTEIETSAVAVATSAYPDLEVTAERLEGQRVWKLLAESERAELLVVGSRHRGTVGSVLLGSVGAGVAARAACPVVVVRGPGGNPGEGARVVAAVDGGADSEQILSYAFDHASRYGLGLRALLCWRPHLYQSSDWFRRANEEAGRQAEVWLAEALAGWRDKYPDVPVTANAMEVHPIEGLVTASYTAHLLVVGSHGHHAVPGTLLGSVSQGALHHATCPVAVLPLHEPVT